MKKIYFFLLLFTSIVFSQNAQDIIGELKKELNNNPDDKKRATIYSDLTWYYSNVSIDSALIYGDKAIEFSRKIKDASLLSQIYSDLGSVHFRNGSFEKSKKFYNKALSLRIKNNDLEGVAKININLASILASNQNFSEAAAYYLKGINYFESKDDTISSITKSNLAVVFLDMRNFSKAKTYILEAIKFQKNNNLDQDLGRSYLILGNIFGGQNQNINAIKSYNLSIELAIKSQDYVTVISGFHNIGSLYLDLNKYNKALMFYEKSKKYLIFLNSDLDKAIYEINIGRCYLLNKKYENAKNILLKNKKILEVQKSNIELSNAYKWLSKSYSYLNKPDSSDYYFEKYNKLNISLINDKNIKQTNELETKYQTEKKEKLLLVKEAEAKQKNTILIALSILAVLIALVGFLIYRQQRLKNKQQEQENDLNKAILKIENQNKLQEQRLSISRDLHDNIGAQLTFIISSVENVKYGFDIQNEKLESKLSNISSFAKDTIVELRDTIWAMNSNEITFQDLESRINNYIEKAKEVQDKISFSFATEEALHSKKLTSVEGMNVYRTIQEAINNSIKYADANVISITAKQLEKNIAIVIKDNGNGFDYQNVEKGNGLNNMQKRIVEIGGTFHLHSDTTGTKIEITL